MGWKKKVVKVDKWTEAGLQTGVGFVRKKLEKMEEIGKGLFPKSVGKNNVFLIVVLSLHSIICKYNYSN